jgi:hypothetical protein
MRGYPGCAPHPPITEHSEVALREREMEDLVRVKKTTAVHSARQPHSGVVPKRLRELLRAGMVLAAIVYGGALASAVAPRKETPSKPTNLEELRRKRAKAAHRKRRIIFNNDCHGLPILDGQRDGGSNPT